MTNADASQTSVRKIISVENREEMEMLKKTLVSQDVCIIKELPLVNGFLCEYMGEKSIEGVNRGLDSKILVEEDLEFRLCDRWDFFFPGYSFFPFWPEPIQPKTPLLPKKGLQNVDWGLKRIGAPQVWDKLKERRVGIGIIDTGINYHHPDLKDNVREGVSTLDGVESFLDDYGHGTHVAGIIGASSKYGKTGINPYVDIYAVKAFNKKGSGTMSDIIEGLDWLMNKPVNIINMSFSTSETNSTLERAMQAAYERGVLIVAAAGNDGGRVNYPARFPSVLAVSATDENDKLGEFSSSGPEVNFCAPGVDINSTWLGSGYAIKSGTSFAAPHITGAAADLLNCYGLMTIPQVVGMLARGAVKIQGLSREQQGAGMVELPRIIR